MTDISPERIEALAAEAVELAEAEDPGDPAELLVGCSNALRALLAEVARLKADNAAKDAVNLELRAVLHAASALDECVNEFPDDISCCSERFQALTDALDLTPAALADCVVVPREPTEKMIVAWEGAQMLREDTEWAQQQPAADGWSEADWHFEAACARSNWRVMLEASRG